MRTTNTLAGILPSCACFWHNFSCRCCYWCCCCCSCSNSLFYALYDYTEIRNGKRVPVSIVSKVKATSLKNPMRTPELWHKFTRSQNFRMRKSWQKFLKKKISKNSAISNRSGIFTIRRDDNDDRLCQTKMVGYGRLDKEESSKKAKRLYVSNNKSSLA